MGKNKKELDEMLSSDSECEKIKEKKVKKKKAKNVDEEEDNESDKVININENPSEKEKKKNKERKCSDTKEEEDDVKESKKKKNKKDKVKKVAESSDDEDEKEDNKKKKKTKDDDEEEVEIKKKDKKKTPVKVDDDDDDDSDDGVVVKKKKQKKVERKSSSSSEDIVIEKPKKSSKTKTEEVNDNDDDNSDEDDEEVKPKVKKTKPKKETKEDDDEDDDDENEKEDKDKEEVKEKPKAKDNNNTQNEEPPQKHLQQKSYSSGTWPELFIKNLSYNTTDVGLADFFSKYGDVEETKVVYDKQSGRSKGVGFCRFYDASSAVKAMEDAGKLTLDGRPIAISYSNERPSATNTQPKFKADTSYQGARYGLFVGNLSFKSNEQGIKNLFEDCGKIIDIRIAKNEQGKMRGFAHVDFDSSESVDKALKKNGFKLDGRELKLDRSESKPARGGNSNVGQGKGRNNTKVDDVTKAKKSGAIIAPKENKVIQFNDSDDDDDE